MAKDRNDIARDDFATARARKQFQDAYAAGAAGAVDRFGRKLQDGDLVQFLPSQPIIFQVTKVGPTMDPNMPPDAVRFELTSTIPFTVRANERIETVTVVFAKVEVAPSADINEPATAIEDHSGLEPEQPAGPVDPAALGSDEP